jgi:hypothetical protein
MQAMLISCTSCPAHNSSLEKDTDRIHVAAAAIIMASLSCRSLNSRDPFANSYSAIDNSHLRYGVDPFTHAQLSVYHLPTPRNLTSFVFSSFFYDSDCIWVMPKGFKLSFFSLCRSFERIHCQPNFNT